MTRRALVIGPGAARGAYEAGVLSVLAKDLGPDYFDTVYASSAGSFNAAYFVSGQPDVMERFWRENGGSKKFFSFRKLLKGKSFLDLNYLAKVFSDGPYRIAVENIDVAKAKLVFLLSFFPSGELEYRKVTSSDCVDYIRASVAMPLLHKPVSVNGNQYSDVSATVVPLPIQQAIDDGHDEVIALYNKHSKYSMPMTPRIIARMFSWRVPQNYMEMFYSYAQNKKKIEDLIESDSRVKVIRPKGSLPVRGHFDPNKKRINATVDLGIEDGHIFLQQMGK